MMVTADASFRSRKAHSVKKGLMESIHDQVMLDQIIREGLNIGKMHLKAVPLKRY